MRFAVSLERDMGMKDGHGRGSFVTVLEGLTREFYQDVVQDLEVWVDPAPRLPQQPKVEAGATARAAESESEAEESSLPVSAETPAAAPLPPPPPPPAATRT